MIYINDLQQKKIIPKYWDTRFQKDRSEMYISAYICEKQQYKPPQV